MVQVNEQLTRDVAELARLELTAEELKTFTSQLSGILRHFEQLQGIDVTNQEIQLGAPVMRNDEVQPPFLDEEGRPAVLQSAPDIVNDSFKVPPVI